jgi:hypothetical protein
MPNSDKNAMSPKEREAMFLILAAIAIAAMAFGYLKFVAPIVSTFDRDRFIAATGAPEQSLFQQTIENADLSDVDEENFKNGMIAKLLDNAICDALPEHKAKDWAGKVSEIRTERSGAGLVAIDIGTANNITVSNYSEDSLYNPKSQTKRLFIDVKDDTYSAISKLSVGDNVLFSGEFIPTTLDAVEDGETMWCARQFDTRADVMAQRPRFVFKFTDIHSAH